MSFGLPPAGSTPAEEWGSKVLKAVDGALDEAGATSQTGGFVDATPASYSPADDLSSKQAPVSGGLGSSVNVQAIAREAQLAQHTEGMTKEDYLKRLSGREQAAAQLAAAQGFAPFGGSSSNDSSSAPPTFMGKSSVEPTEKSRTDTRLPFINETALLNSTPTVAEHNATLITPQTTAPATPAIVVPVIVPAAVVVPAVMSTPSQLEGTKPPPHSAPRTGDLVAERPKASTSLVEDVKASQPDLPELLPSRYIPADTPMVEGLPGGWMGSLKTSVPGTDVAHPETTIYQDVVAGLDTVGQTAYQAIPQGLKDSINPNRAHPGPGLLDQAKNLVGQVHLPQMPEVHLPKMPKIGSVDRSQAVVAREPKESRSEIGSSQQSFVQRSPTELVDQAKRMASDLLAGTRSRAEEAYAAAQNFADKATGSAVPQTTSVSRSAQQLTSGSMPAKPTGKQQVEEINADSSNVGGPVTGPGEASLLQGSRDKDNHIANESEEAKAVVAKDSSNVSPPTTSDGIVDSGPGQSAAAVIAARRSEDQSPTDSAESSLPEAHQDRRESNLAAANAPLGILVPAAERNIQPDSQVSTASERHVSPSPFQAHETTSSDEAPVTDLSTPSAAAIPQRQQAVDAGTLGHNIDTTTSIFSPSITEGPYVPQKRDFTAQTSSFSPAAYNLAPPLGVFNEVTPIAGEMPSVLSGGIVPAKPENPVEVIPVQELDVHTPFLGSSAVAQPLRELEREHSDATYPTHDVGQEDSATPGLSSRSESIDNNVSTGKLDAPSAARSDSSASVTAIKHGHLGQHHPEESSHTLGSISEKELPPAPVQVSPAQTTRTAEAPAQAVPVKTSATTSSTMSPPTPVKSRSSMHSDAQPSSAGSGHQRTDSAVSTSSKKKGFFSKLKEKMHHESK